jgi:hypothetical protein
MTLETRLGDLIISLGTDYKTVKTWIFGSLTGTLADLDTPDKTSLVGAINDAYANGGGTVDPATETQAGIVELATDVEALALTTDGSVLTPGNLGAITNVNNGIPKLDGTGKLAAAQLPSYVDDVIEAANLGAFPGSGEAGKIYVAQDTGNAYRWSGSAYVEIVASPGSTDEVTEGVTNLYFTNARADARADARIAALVGDTDVDLAAAYTAAKA